MITVTKTYLPPLEEYIQYLQGIWERGQIANHGPLVQELEQKLKEYLGVKYLYFVSNGTIALQIAIKALDLHDEIITTPFSYVATTSSIVWDGCQPVFVDIDPKTLCINPINIEKAISSRTKAILTTHVYGYPCDIEHIQGIADKFHLKVIYDAAHAFGVRYKNNSIMNYGNISTLSFHATKLFHTGEGGALVTNDYELAQRIAYMLNFGHKGQEEFWGLGINGKNSELHAALGLCILPKMEELISRRQAITHLYDNLLRDSPLTRPSCSPETLYNYAYYPVIFPFSEMMLRTIKALNEKEIYPRRYFYPALNSLPYLSPTNMPIAEDIADRILCLPLSSYLSDDEVRFISKVLLAAL